MDKDLKTKFIYDYPRPMVTVDVVLFNYINKKNLVLLIKRKNEPYSGYWSLPGGFVDMDEELETAALRELEEETGLKNIAILQLGAYGNIGRDPRGRTISVVYFAQLINFQHIPVAGDDAADVQWFFINSLPLLAFDHQKIIDDALTKIVHK